MGWDRQVPCHPIDGPGIVYIEVPKAGCTSVKTMLAPFRGASPPAGDEIHHWFGYLQAYDCHELRSWLEDRWRGYFRFTVVREPVARFESFVYGLHPDDDINDFALDRLRRETDIHAARQADLLGWDLSGFDFVGRLEDPDTIERTLSDVVGQELHFPHLNASTAEREPLSAEALQVVRAHYRPDFELLRYP